jgi:hypothetical protein
MIPPVDVPHAPPRIGVLERNRTVMARITRVVRAASGFDGVAADADPASLRAQLDPETQLLLCDAADLDLACAWTTDFFPAAQIISWSHGPMDQACELAARYPQVRSLLAWPSFHSMPRPWELALAVRRALRPATSTLHLKDVFVGPPVYVKFRPRDTQARDAVASELVALADRAGAQGRLTGKIGEVAHELLMNAIYDAPVNHYGEPRYAHDRRADVFLDEHEIPSARFACDGNLLAIQVNDPFGRLTRDHVLRGVVRGQTGARAADPNLLVDTSNGGAGLGLWRIYAASAMTIFDIIPGHTTSVTAIFDIDVNPRDARTMPSSLHLFDGAVVL